MVREQIPLDQLIRLTPIAIKTYIRLMNLWEIKTQERWDLLGGTPPFNLERYEGWNPAHDIALSEDQLFRIGLLLKIATCLQILLGPQLCWEWPQKPNASPLMKGQTALRYMIDGGLPAIINVYKLLKGQMQCHFL